MAEAIKRAGDTDSAKIIAELGKTAGDFVTGSITFDSNGDPVKSISIIQLVDGIHKLAAKVEGK